MLLNKILFTFLSLSFVLAYPFKREDELILARAVKPQPAKPAPAKPVPGKPKPPTNQPAAKPASKPVVLQSSGSSFEEQARKANNAPGRQVPTKCKKASDCSCPKTADKNGFSSTSCINGSCSCNNSAVNFFAKTGVEAVKAVGDAPVTKAIGHVMKGISDVKEVLGTVAGTFLGPEAKAALKIGLNVIPDTGPSHIDDATNGVTRKISNLLG